MYVYVYVHVVVFLNVVVFVLPPSLCWVGLAAPPRPHPPCPPPLLGILLREAGRLPPPDPRRFPHEGPRERPNKGPRVKS